MIALKGGCHCGNITFDLSWSNDVIQARQCSCTFCRKHNASWTSHVDSELVITTNNPSHLSKYLFGTKTAEFYICGMCGVPPVALSRIDGRDYAVVNISTIDNLENINVTKSGTNFDGEGTDDRLERRKRNWINHVHVTDG